MKKVRQKIRQVLCLCLCILCSGCMVVIPKYQIPHIKRLPQPPAGTRKCDLTYDLDVDLNWHGFSYYNYPGWQPSDEKLYARAIERTLHESGYFRSIRRSSTGGGDIHAKINLEWHAYNSILYTLIFPATLFMLPNWNSGGEDLGAQIIMPNDERITYEISEGCYDVRWLPLILLYPINDPGSADLVMLKYLVRHLVTRMKDDGLLPLPDKFSRRSVGVDGRVRPVIEPVALPMRRGERANIAVANLTPFSVDPVEAQTLSEKVRATMVESDYFRVVSRDDMANILKEQQFQRVDSCDSSECLVEMGKLLAVQYIVGGSVGKVGKTSSITLRMMSVETGQIVVTADMQTEGAADYLLDVVHMLGRKLARDYAVKAGEGK